MSKAFRFKLNYAGVGQLLKSGEMQSMLSQVAHSKASQAGSGYGSKTEVLGTRAVAYVFTDDIEARRDNYENNTLLKVVR